MYIRIALVTLLLWCAACTQDSPPGLGQANHPVREGTAGVASAAGFPVRVLHVRNRSFANLPDRGDLVAYPARRVIRHDGAYTWHRADLSEEHALRAIGSGVMHFTTPAGKRLQFQYERHVEHPSGDWTWIGRAKGGAAADEVVLTFGEKAAFGSISQPGQAPLKLTMSGGVSWLIETDPSLIAGIDNSATRPRKPDFLVPPKFKAGLGASTESSTAAVANTTGNAQAVATTTVDVLLGYTGGFAAAQGGQSQAVTRLYNMVEIANQAYANSQIDGRIRLVHALQVNYPDNTSNGSALEALTGFRAPSTRTTPDPAFAALRAARDQYGADLVSLVRQFNTPENDGCGIAWLIGGGQSGIASSDEYFGYSVVSDGRDVGTDGKTYFCREETLAHELGHNMGSQHDRVAATVDGSLKYGVYPYSFGYKTALGAGNFYTVMSYGDTGQTAYRIFSNPRSYFCGVACGVENQADNARSLGQAMPTVATFRATLVAFPAAAKPDIEGDGKADLIWYRLVDGLLAYWVMNGPTIARHGSVPVGGEFRILATGDFNGDGRADIIWNRPAGDMQYWAGDGESFAHRQYFAGYPSGWDLVGTGDVDGDGRTDLIWYRPADGRLAYWVMNGPTVTRHGDILVGGSYRIAALGDFNGDGRVDLIWNRPAGDMQYWAGDGANFGQRQYFTAFPAAWNLEGVGDIDGDGRSDLVWYRPSDGRLAYWVMNGPSVTRYGDVLVGGDFRISAIRDFNGDGRADLIWNRAAGDMQHWTGDGADFSQRQSFTTYPGGWQLIPADG